MRRRRRYNSSHVDKKYDAITLCFCGIAYYSGHITLGTRVKIFILNSKETINLFRKRFKVELVLNVIIHTSVTLIHKNKFKGQTII